MKRIAIFGFRDSSVGQLLNFLDPKEYEVECFTSVSKLPKIDENLEHKNRPNSKTEFVKDNLLLGKEVNGRLYF